MKKYKYLTVDDGTAMRIVESGIEKKKRDRTITAVFYNLEAFKDWK